jgi:polar amino acid transport system substrate-binding protein
MAIAVAGACTPADEEMIGCQRRARMTRRTRRSTIRHRLEDTMRRMRRFRISCLMVRASLAAGALAGALLMPAVSSAQAPQAKAPEVGELPRRVAIRFLTDSDFPPFHYYDEEGVLTGFNVDMARAVCLELAAACDVQVRPWAELMPALKRGETDAVIASHSITPRALQEFDFTDRYYFTPAWFAGRRGGPTLVPTPEGLEGQRIGVARGSPHEAYLKTFFRDSGIIAFENGELARDALTGGKVDLIFDDGISLAFWLNGTLSRECCEFKGGPYHEPKFFGDGVGIAVRKQDPQLKGLINQALRRVRETGRYEELMLRYFPSRVY